MVTKKEIEEELNELGAPLGELKSCGGRIPDNSKYGSWLRYNDPIAFNVFYNDRVREDERRQEVKDVKI